MENHWIENWLSLQENLRTRASYQTGMEKFASFCTEHRFNGLETVGQEYRATIDDDDRRKLSQYTNAWADVVQEYTIWLKDYQKLASASRKTYLTILQSFFSKYKLPIEVDIPKRAYATYPKKDLSQTHGNIPWLVK